MKVIAWLIQLLLMPVYVPFQYFILLEEVCVNAGGRGFEAYSLGQNVQHQFEVEKLSFTRKE